MFQKAIEINNNYTKPIYSISRRFDSTEIDDNIGTFIIINNEGWILTCKHVADLLIVANQVLSGYPIFKNEFDKCKNKSERRSVMKKFKVNKDTIIQMKNLVVGIPENKGIENMIAHEYLDLALVKYNIIDNEMWKHFPIFAADNASIGESVCKLGYPFPEFNCYKYNKVKDDIEWDLTNEELTRTPIFPLEGMIVQYKTDERGKVTMFRTSTPGLRGQSGGPIFNRNGEIIGIQSITEHLDLGFDIDVKLKRGSVYKQAKEFSFIHLGAGINVQAIKDFLNENHINFTEALNESTLTENTNTTEPVI